jgi:hypothetical protein
MDETEKFINLINKSKHNLTLAREEDRDNNMDTDFYELEFQTVISELLLELKQLINRNIISNYYEIIIALENFCDEYEIELSNLVLCKKSDLYSEIINVREINKKSASKKDLEKLKLFDQQKQKKKKEEIEYIYKHKEDYKKMANDTNLPYRVRNQYFFWLSKIENLED